MKKQNHIEEFNNILENDALLDVFSTVGLTEEINQDSFELSSSNNLTVLILASGLGGGTIAELISSMAAEKAFELLVSYQYEQKSPEEITLFLKSIFFIINDLILDYINVSNIQGYATTLSIVLIYQNSLFTAHTGESRIYLIRKDDIPILLSKDPSYSKKFSENQEESEASYFLGNESYEEKNIFVTDEVNLVHKEKLFVCSKNILDYIPENKFDKEIEEIKGMIDEKPALLSSTFLRYTHYESSIEKMKVSVEDLAEEQEERQIDWERLMPFLKKIALFLGIILVIGFFYLIVKGLFSIDTVSNEYQEGNNSLVENQEMEVTLKNHEKVKTIESSLRLREKVQVEQIIDKKLKLLQKKDSSIFHVGDEGIRITFKENRLISSKLGTFHVNDKNPKEIYCELKNIDSDLNGNFINKLEKQIFSDKVSIKSKNKSVRINIKIKDECRYTQSVWGKNNGLDLFIFRCEEEF